jgi:hypothetical protein
VHSGLVLERAVDAVAGDGHARVLDPSGGVLGAVEQRHLPPAPLRVAQVHAQDLGGEEARLVAAGAGANLEDHVAVVVLVPGEQQDFELLLQPGELLAQGRQLLLSHLAHVGILVHEQRLVVAHLVADPLELAEGLDQRLELVALLGHLGEAGAVGDDLRVAQVGRQPFEFLLDFLQLVFHASCQLPECLRGAGSYPRGPGRSTSDAESGGPPGPPPGRAASGVRSCVGAPDELDTASPKEASL